MRHEHRSSHGTVSGPSRGEGLDSAHEALLRLGTGMGAALGALRAAESFVASLRETLELDAAVVLTRSSSGRLEVLAGSGMPRRPGQALDPGSPELVQREPNAQAFVGARHGKLGRDLLAYLQSAGCPVEHGLAFAIADGRSPAGLLLVARARGRHFEEREVRFLARLVERFAAPEPPSLVPSEVAGDTPPRSTSRTGPAGSDPHPVDPPRVPGEAAGFDVLVVEDNPVNRKITSRFLQKLGHRPVLAEDGRQALERLREQRFDAIFMDCQMPILDGYETVAELRARERAAGSDHVPVIALTANVSREDRERCFEVGMDAYLNKPVRIDDLDSALAALVGSKLRDGS